MDFLCPSCQKMLTVPDQYAGTLMKCPLCQNTFQAPALPAQPPPLAAAPAPSAAPAEPAGAEVYGLQEPDLATSPPPKAPAAPPPALSAVSASPGSPPPAFEKISPPPPPLPPSTDYRGGFTIPIRSQVFPWVAPVCLVLLFLFCFFSWVGYYWGGEGVLTQSAWGAAFGSSAPDQDWQQMSGFNDKQKEQARPTANVVLIFYLLLLLISVPVSIAVLLVTVAPPGRLHVPPALTPVLPYRWAIITALCALLFLLLCLQLVLGFTMEHNAYAAVVEKVGSDENPPKTKEEERVRIGKEYNSLGVQRTVWLRVAFFLNLVALAGAGLTYWIEQRGTHLPAPQFVLRW